MRHPGGLPRPRGLHRTQRPHGDLRCGSHHEGHRHRHDDPRAVLRRCHRPRRGRRHRRVGRDVHGDPVQREQQRQGGETHRHGHHRRRRPAAGDRPRAGHHVGNRRCGRRRPVVEVRGDAEPSQQPGDPGPLVHPGQDGRVGSLGERDGRRARQVRRGLPDQKQYQPGAIRPGLHRVHDLRDNQGRRHRPRRGRRHRRVTRVVQCAPGPLGGRLRLRGFGRQDRDGPDRRQRPDAGGVDRRRRRGGCHRGQGGRLHGVPGPPQQPHAHRGRHHGPRRHGRPPRHIEGRPVRRPAAARLPRIGRPPG